MALQWYWVAGISGGLALILMVIITIVSCCCCDDNNKTSDKNKKQNGSLLSLREKRSTRRKKGGYSEVQQRTDYNNVEEPSNDSAYEEVEDIYMSRSTGYPSKRTGYKEDEPIQENEPITVYVAPLRHKAIDTVSSYDDTIAESSVSDVDSENVSISAYGDQASIISNERKASWMGGQNVANLNISIQASLIYSRDMKYVAGKIIQMEGLSFNEGGKAPFQVKVHVVVLPIKKYALKTNWYDIKKAKSKIDEYFKFKFKQPPSEGKTMFRFRMYGRKMNFGVFGRERCFGECYVNLREIVTSRGGLTIWRPITRGAPEAIVEEAE